MPLFVLLARFPPGRYHIVGTGLKGEKRVGGAKFRHNIPAAPVLLSPAENAVVGPAHLVLTWQRVGPANGSPIIGYQVLVVKPNTGLRGLPKIILDVTMSPGADRMAVPAGFLLRDSAYEWEVLTIASGGNQTLSVGHFRTPKGTLSEAVTAMNREITREFTRELTRALALPEWRCACGRQMLKDS